MFSLHKKILAGDAIIRDLIDQDTKWCVEHGPHNSHFYKGRGYGNQQDPHHCYLQKDVQIWKGTNAGEFSFRSSYRSLSKR